LFESCIRVLHEGTRSSLVVKIILIEAATFFFG